MKKSIRIFLILVSLSTSTICFGVDIDPFTKIKVLGNLKINIHQGDAEKIEVTNNDSSIVDSDIVIEVVKSELNISIKGDNFHEHDITLDIWCKSLSGIDVRRGAFVKLMTAVESDSLGLEVASGGHIVGDISCRTLFAAISKGGSMRIGGKASKAEYNVFAGGDLYALLMDSEDIVAKIRTGGEVTVTGKATLDVLIFSGGKVSYKGNPKLTQEIKITGDIIKLDK